MSEQPTLRRERLFFSKRYFATPIAIFLLVLLAYGMSVAAMLASPLWTSAVLVPITGILVSMLFVIGHDACHQSFTSSRLLNHVIGRIAFLPSLHVFSLWDREHNQRHHQFNNIRHLDYAWIPMSPDQFTSASPWQRQLYRMYRHPLGVGLYYLFEIWPKRKIMARRSMLGVVGPVHIVDTVLVWVFIATDVTVLAVAGAWFNKGIAVSITIGLLLPFVIFTTLISLATFLHHTHPTISWYSTLGEWEDDDGAIHGTAHVELPWNMQILILFILEHTAHHYAPGVPLYNLTGMQHVMNKKGALTWRFTLRRYREVCRSCKLFDYDQRHWLDFDGTRTSDFLRPKPKTATNTTEPFLHA